MSEGMDITHLSADNARSIADSLADEFNETGLKHHLDKSIEYYRIACDLSCPRSKEDAEVVYCHVNHLLSLGLALQNRAHLNEITVVADLVQAIDCYEKCRDFLEPNDSLYLPTTLDKLGCALRAKYESTRDEDALDDSIVAHRAAVLATPKQDDERASRLSNLGYALECRLDNKSSTEDSTAALEAMEEAVQVSSASDPNRLIYLNNLAGVFHVSYDNTKSMQDLYESIKYYEIAAAESENNVLQHAMFQKNLGTCLRELYTHTGLSEDWERSVRCIEKAVKLTPRDNPGRASRLLSLSLVYKSQFEKTGTEDVLELGIDACKEAVQLTPKEHYKRDLALNTLADLLRLRFEKSGSTNDLNQAIDASAEGLRESVRQHPANINNYAISLTRRFSRLGNREDLNHAIRLLYAVKDKVLETDPQRAIYFENLSGAIRLRFERVGSSEDLDLAIKVVRDGIQTLLPHDTFGRANLLGTLGSALVSAFHKTGDICHLNEAIASYSTASQILPEKAFYRVEILIWLADSLRLRCSVPQQSVRRESDLSRALDLIQMSLDILTEGSPLSARVHNVHGQLLRIKYGEKVGDNEDITGAVEAFRRAVRDTPLDHLDHSRYLNDLATALVYRGGGDKDLEEAITAFEESANNAAAPPSIRIAAAVHGARLIFHRDQMNIKASELFKTAIELLPFSTAASLNLLDQQDIVSGFAGLPSEAAAIMLTQGVAVEDVIRLLEIGRGVIIGRILDLRSDLQGLPDDLVTSYENVRATLDPQATLLPKNPMKRNDPSDRHVAELELLSLLGKIRQTPGHEKFLLPPSDAELRSIAQNGAVVILNVSQLRSDAFLITGTRISVLSLPLLKFDELRTAVDKFSTAIDNRGLRHHADAKDQLAQILEWLWDAAIFPVLHELGFDKDHGQWPRVCWIGNGSLQALPLHAAGHHNSKPPRTALDLVISSYAPTLKSLSRAQKNAKRLGDMEKQNAIIIGMPTTPGQFNLTFVDDETRAVQTLLSHSAAIRCDLVEHPSRNQILATLPHQQIVHFACHGVPSEIPLKSSLLLKDWQEKSLTVADIIALNINSAVFAYLSACHTSRIKNSKLLDESLNISSSIQLSGYPSVVSTLWKVLDEESVAVAKSVYAYMLRKGTRGRLNAEQAAEALHWTIRELRDKTRKIPGLRRTVHSDPLIWAPYIHIGA